MILIVIMSIFKHIHYLNCGGFYFILSNIIGLPDMFINSVFIFILIKYKGYE